MKEESKNTWTIGYSTGTRKFPQYNKAILEISLPQSNIQYFHLKNLGERRKVNPGSKNTAWRQVAFRSYADYMETDAFKCF